MTPFPLLALFYSRAGDCRLAEFEAVALRLGAPAVDWSWDSRLLETNGGDIGPRIVQWLPSLPEADRSWLGETAARCVGCRGVFEVWGQGQTLEDCAAATARIPVAYVRERVKGSWRVESAVLGSRKSQHPGSLRARMDAFGTLLDSLEDRVVDLKDPDCRIWLVEDRQTLRNSEPVPDPPPRFLLLFQLQPGAAAIQARMAQLDTRKRAFLSTSTLPADRALLLCNLGLARAPQTGATVLDPYCGSGGILLAAAALGAQTVGSDLDWRMVSENPWPMHIPASPGRPERGRERVRMRDNFVEALLPEPKALLTLDVSAPDAAETLLRANEGRSYDALVCDPPYGRREFQGGLEGWAGELAFKVDGEALGSTLRALFLLARQTLKSSGCLVFLTPLRSPNDENKPRLEDLRSTLAREGAAHGLSLRHIGVEVIHRGLHRAAVVMDRD
ncbi:MAG: tRNA G10 N-methylase Trm11 [Cognaticolwellia sp.]|jgi:tRNA G10  N-methylase Trm11